MHRLHQLTEPHLQRQGHHAGAGHHHLAHLGVAQREQTLEHVAFVRHQAGDAVGLDQGFELTGGEGRHKLIPLARQTQQPQQPIAQPLDQQQHGGQAAAEGLKQWRQPQG